MKNDSNGVQKLSKSDRKLRSSFNPGNILSSIRRRSLSWDHSVNKRSVASKNRSTLELDVSQKEIKDEDDIESGIVLTSNIN